MRIDLDETEISFIRYIEYQSEFLKTFVNQKLILESNKYRDEKIQYQISLNINNLVNESLIILNQSNLETRELDNINISQKLKDGFNENLLLIDNSKMKGLIKQIDLLSKENIELNT